MNPQLTTRNSKTSSPSIPSGYKQTEVGVIPEEWKTCPCSELSERIMVGIVIRPTQYYVKRGVPAFRSANIRENGINDLDLVFISEAANEFLVKSQTQMGDVLTVRTGYPGTSAVVRPIHAGCNCIDILITRPTKKLDSDWLATWINSSIGKEQILRNQGGLAQKHFNVGDMRNLIVALPPLPEQRAIATALSDVDALIASLDQLIAKKRDLKQAAMQQLLTGQTRLPGFEVKSGYKQTLAGIIPKDWDVRFLGNICDKITTGKLDANAMVATGEYPFFTCAKEHYWIDNYAFDIEALLVSGNGANVGYIHYYSGKFNAYQRTYVLTGFLSDIHFIKLFMERYLQERLRTEVNAGNTPYIVMDTLAKMNVALPPNKDEQAAIAEVLSGMDAELIALEQRMEKTRMLKQGMMQELLTGRTRLV